VAEERTPGGVGAAMRRLYAPRAHGRLADHVAARWGVEVTRVTPLEIGVYRVDRRAGPPWVARVFLPERPLARAEAEVLAFLAGTGLPAERPAAPDPVSVMDGQPVVVTELVEGRVPDASVATLESIADLTGRLHALPPAPGAPSRPGGSLRHVPGYERLPGEDLVLAAALLDDMDGRIPADRRRPYERLRTAVAAADDCAGLPAALVHPDPVRKNAIVGPDGVPVLVDWAGTVRGPRVASLAVLLVEALSTGGWDRARVRAIMAAYGRHVSPSPAERARLGAAVLIRRLWLAAWQYWVGAAMGRPPTGTEGPKHLDPTTWPAPTARRGPIPPGTSRRGATPASVRTGSCSTWAPAPARSRPRWRRCAAG
jgi:Ser/Thr protein kinase RdoA (MazF antagonist)